MDEKPVKRVNRLEQGTGKLRKGEERLMNDASVFFGTLNDLSTLIAIMEPNGNIIFVNNTGMDLADLKPKDVLGKKFYDRYWWQYSEKAIQLIKNDTEMCASGKTMVREIEAQAANGELVWIEFSVHPIFDENGIVKYLVAEARDITGRKKAEEALQKSHQTLKKEVKKQTAELVKSNKQLKHEIKKHNRTEAMLKDSDKHYRKLFKNALAGLFRSRISDGKILDCNDVFAKMTGYATREECIAECYTTRHYVDPGARQQMLKELLKNGEIKDFETAFKKTDDSVVWLSCSALIVSGTDYFEGVTIDVTGRKQSDEEIKKNAVYIDAMGDALVVIDMQKKVIKINNASSEMWGYTIQEMSYLSVDQLTPEREHKKIFSEMDNIIETGSKRSFETIILTKDTGEIPVLLSGTVLKGKDEKPAGFIGVFRDISDRKQALESLKKSEAKYSTLVENSMDGIGIVQDAKMKYMNRVCLRILGLLPEEITGMKCLDLIAPEYRSASVQRAIHRKEGKTITFINKSALVRKDGATVPVEVTATEIDYEGKPAYLIAVRDLTKQIKAEQEREKLQVQLQQAHRLEALGTLAGGISHDFNNLLMGIQGRASLILMDIDSSHPHFDHLQGIEEHVKSAANLTGQLLGFSRGGKCEVKTTDLNRLIKDSSKMFGRTKKEIKIHNKYQKGVWMVEADQGQIEQVVLNLFVNAWQAMPGGGDIYIETNNVILDKDYTKAYHVTHGKYVKITITDNGSGMDEATRQKIFEPFFSTKEKGRGTGLGLASAYGIIKNHDGFINVYSEQGEGTTFNIHLPATEKKGIKEQEPLKEILKGEGTVLLVDDEDMIIDIGVRMLESIGYKVLKTTGGKEAVEIYKANRDKIDLVILDMIMPDMGGGATFDRLKEINPDIKIVLASGYSVNGQAKEILKRGCKGFIQKPFNTVELSRKIREVLDGR